MMDQESHGFAGRVPLALELLFVVAVFAGCAAPPESESVQPTPAPPGAAGVPQPQRESSPHHLVLAQAPGDGRTTVFAVVDPEGERVSGALIDVWMLELESTSSAEMPRLDAAPLGGPPHHCLISSGTDGTVRVTLQRGQHLALRAEREDIGASGYVVPGHRWEAGELVPHASKQGPLPFWESLRLRKPSTLRGRVVAADGGPAAGVTVRVSVVPPSGLGWPTIHSRNPGDVITDAEGRFELAFDGATQITLSSASPAHRLQAGLILREGAVVETSFYAEGARFVAGRVVDQDGRPVEGVDLRALDEVGLAFESLGTTPVGEARSDRDGGFRLPVSRDGAFELLASKAGWVAREPVLLKAEHGVPLQDVTVPLVPATRIRGIVLQADGEAVAGARVMASLATSLWERLSPSHFRSTLLRGAESGPDGSFTLEDIHADQDYTVKVWLPGRRGPLAKTAAEAHWSPNDQAVMVLQIP